MRPIRIRCIYVNETEATRRHLELGPHRVAMVDVDVSIPCGACICRMRANTPPRGRACARSCSTRSWYPQRCHHTRPRRGTETISSTCTCTGTHIDVVTVLLLVRRWQREVCPRRAAGRCTACIEYLEAACALRTTRTDDTDAYICARAGGAAACFGTGAAFMRSRSAALRMLRGEVPGVVPVSCCRRVRPLHRGPARPLPRSCPALSALRAPLSPSLRAPAHLGPPGPLLLLPVLLPSCCSRARHPRRLAFGCLRMSLDWSRSSAVPC